MAESETDRQNGHNHCRGSGKNGRWAACGCGISLISSTFRRSHTHKLRKNLCWVTGKMRYITLTQILPSPITTQYNKVSTLPLPLVPYIICGLPLAWFFLLPDCDILLSFHVPYVRTERYCSFVSRAFKHRHTTRPQATCNEYLMKFGDLVLEIWFWGYFLFICCALSLPGGFRVLADASICTPVYLFAYSFLTNPASWLPEPIKVITCFIYCICVSRM